MQRPDFGRFERFSGGEAGGAHRAWRGVDRRNNADRRAAGAGSSAWTLLQKSGEPMLLVAADGKVSFANYAAHRLLGYDPNTLDGLSWLSWVHPLHEDALRALLDKLRRQPESHDICEMQLCDRYGNWRWFEISLTNLLVDSLGWFVQLRDVTLRHEAGERQSHFETQFAEVQRLASLGTWEWDVQSRRLFWSEELYHIIGISPGETQLTLETLVARMHPDDRERTVQAIERAVRERRTLDVHYRVVRPSGAVRTLHCRARIVSDDGGRVVRLSGIAQDVTETLQADLELRESEARFRRLADSNIIGIVSWDACGHISEANDAFLRIVGYTRADLWEGRLRWNELTPPEFHDVDVRALQELADRGVCMPYEKEYIRKDGSRVPILMGAAYLEPGSGRDLGICFVLNMSDHRYQQQALREADTGTGHEAGREVPIYEAFSDLYLRLDTQGTVLACHAAESGCSLLLEQVVGKNVQDIFPSPTNSALAGTIAEVARTRRALRLEYEIPIAGHAHCFEVRLQPLLDGQIVATVREMRKMHEIENTSNG